MDKILTPNIEPKSLSEQEQALYLILKPYIGHCLVMNHELNNPLAGIIGYSEFLIEEVDGISDEHRNFLRQILKSAERIQKMIEQLCQEKIELMEKIDLAEVTEAYQKVAKKLD